MGEGEGEGRGKGKGKGEGRTDGVSGGEFLLRRYDGSGALGGVQGAFAADDGFALAAGAAALGLGADFGDGVPVVHGRREGGQRRCGIFGWRGAGVSLLVWLC